MLIAFAGTKAAALIDHILVHMFFVCSWATSSDVQGLHLVMHLRIIANGVKEQYEMLGIELGLVLARQVSYYCIIFLIPSSNIILNDFIAWITRI